jgi:hypothetical protein
MKLSNVHTLDTTGLSFPAANSCIIWCAPKEREGGRVGDDREGGGGGGERRVPGSGVRKRTSIRSTYKRGKYYPHSSSSHTFTHSPTLSILERFPSLSSRAFHAPHSSPQIFHSLNREERKKGRKEGGINMY